MIYQECSLWPTASNRHDGIWEHITSPPWALALSDRLPWERQGDMLKAALRRGPHGEELRLPAPSWVFFFFKIFLMWTTFKVFIEFVTVLILFYLLVFWLRGMWDLGSLTRDRTRTPCIGRRSLNHWTTKKVPPAESWDGCTLTRDPEAASSGLSDTGR